MPINIYVNGIGGLGNCLFQISTAIYYKEMFGGNILLNNNNKIKFGTSNKFGRKQNVIKLGKDIPYTETIFKCFDMCKKGKKNCIKIHNDNTNNKIVPSKNILISGYCQNIHLFEEYLHKVPQYLNLNDPTIINYIKSKYENIEQGIFIGLRVGDDFKHMKKITRKSYQNALEKLKYMNINIDNLFVVSDVDDAWVDKFDLQNLYPATFINENDITQIYVGLMCKHYILSESTFHLWIAYLGTINNIDKKVIVFKDTDLTNRPLSLDNWIKVDLY
uniref:Glycosyl transferase family 11 n=1 Tax=viral metagenome TaxID=1070528 RepID=A0A6C0F724_9ZZZZ|tara:strand:+ start:1860 stop:2684 length:825 start_codon:yes stop_codon:yes gene_type:complete